MILYRYARQYEDWKRRHPVVDPALSDDVNMPCGVGDTVRVRYRGGVHYYTATVTAVHWGHGSTKPLSYSVKYVVDGVVEHGVLREHMHMSQKAFTKALAEAPYNKVGRLRLWNTSNPCPVSPCAVCAAIATSRFATIVPAPAAAHDRL